MTHSSPGIATLIEAEAKRRCLDAGPSLEYLACQDLRFAHDDRRPWWQAMFVGQIKGEIERLEKAGLIVSAPAQTPCTVHDTDINGHCQRCGETILRISKVTPPQAASAAEECARIAESHVGCASPLNVVEGRDSAYDEACEDIARAIRDAAPAAPQTSGSTDEDHPDCTTPRERELYEALMLVTSSVSSRRSEWDNWMQGGVKVAPIVKKALRLDALSRPRVPRRSFLRSP